jgi:AcrR family transcriptional regulator
MRTAERLFARHGIDAVSLNEIVHAAKTNAAAIHYHFGNRQGLIEAMVQKRQAAWGTVGHRMIAELEAKPEVTAHEVVAVMVEPIAALRAQPWGHDYIRFISELASHRRYAVILHHSADEHTIAYVKQLERITPGMPDDIRLARYAYLRRFVYDAVAAGDERVAMWLDSMGQSPAGWTTGDFIDMLTGAMTAPVSSID